MKRFFYRWLVLFCFPTMLLAQGSAFVVNDIRVEGLQRISANTVFAALPISIGDPIDRNTVQDSIRSLFNTGNFDDIQIGIDEGVLVVSVVERPSINEISIEGNKAIETEPLLDGLKGAGLSEGKVFKRSTLEGMRLELQRQYVSQGRYDATIETDVQSETRNRVNININIDEGNVAKIKQINFIGNTVFDDDKLENLMELKSTGWFSFLSGNDKYSKEKLSGDLETLRSYYLDRGYVNFDFESTQVSITPDRKAVYISILLDEGDKYSVKGVELSGDIVVPEEELKKFLIVRDGQTFSQQLITTTEELLTKRLGNDGYNFARVKGITEANDEEQTVAIKFFVDPGKRTYVRRISFSGNARTEDEVLRREMRQMEGAPASSANIEQSRVRLQRLGFFKGAEVDIQQVPGADDLIDVNYEVEEQSSGSIGASVGFSQDSGLILGANLQENNFLGTGNRVGIGISKSDYRTAYSFNYINPYYTEDGVSRGFNVYYRTTDLEEINVASYSADTYGAAVSFGYPIKETERLQFSLGYSNTLIKPGRNAAQEIIGTPRIIEGFDFDSYFLDQSRIVEVDTDGDGELEAYERYDAAEVLEPFDLSSSLVQSFLVPDSEKPVGFLDENGDEFDNFTITTGWNQSTLNRGQLATRGASQSLSLEITLPGSDLEYYKLRYSGQLFIPLGNTFTMRLRTELAYGDGFGSTDGLPFFENFYAGGFGSVRGYRSNTLGPRTTPGLQYRYRQPAITVVEDTSVVDSDFVRETVGEYAYIVRDGKILTAFTDTEGDPFGGNILVEGSAEILFPLPFVEDQRSIRSAFFVDGGNVFDSDCGESQVGCHGLNLRELRYSVGVGLTWITGFGPLTFSVAKAIDPEPTDEREFFQFSLGRSF